MQAIFAALREWPHICTKRGGSFGKKYFVSLG
jgi:hypothetical protein